MLRSLADAAAEHSHVPYSGKPRGAALLLSDGAWIPGARLESASFSLTVPAVSAATAAAVVAGRSDVVALAVSGGARKEDGIFLEGAPAGPLHTLAPAFFVSGNPIPFPGSMLALTKSMPAGFSPSSGIAMARTAARRSHSPHSGFPVGCAALTGAGMLVLGTNVEHRDWTRTVCAERSAVATALSLGFGDLTAVYVSCLVDAQGSPCGACLQVLAEFAPNAALWLDRGDALPEETSVSALLPSSFLGHALRRR